MRRAGDRTLYRDACMHACVRACEMRRLRIAERNPSRRNELALPDVDRQIDREWDIYSTYRDKVLYNFAWRSDVDSYICAGCSEIAKKERILRSAFVFRETSCIVSGISNTNFPTTFVRVIHSRVIYNSMKNDPLRIRCYGITY